MNLARPALAGPESRPGRGDGGDPYVRYTAVLTAQLEALDADDLARFAELADERDLLAREMDATGASGAPAAADRAIDETARESVRGTLETCVDLDRRILERLRGLREETLRAIRELDARRPRVRGYVHATAPAMHVDVRL